MAIRKEKGESTKLAAILELLSFRSRWRAGIRVVLDAYSIQIRRCFYLMAWQSLKLYDILA